jgi:hypothetical protein
MRAQVLYNAIHGWTFKLSTDMQAHADAIAAIAQAINSPVGMEAAKLAVAREVLKKEMKILLFFIIFLSI